MRLAASLRRTPYRTLMMRIRTGEVPGWERCRTLLAWGGMSIGSAEVKHTTFEYLYTSGPIVGARCESSI